MTLDSPLLDTSGKPEPGTATGPEAKQEDAARSALQVHIGFWDPKATGVIWPRDIYSGFIRLGFHPILALLAAPIIGGALSFKTQTARFPDLRLPIYTERIHLSEHGSDSGSFDKEGQFNVKKLEEVFSEHDKGAKGALSLAEVKALTASFREPRDVAGWTGSWLEWLTSYYLAAKTTPAGTFLYKEDVLGIIDGTLFSRVSKELAEGLIVRRGFFKAGFRVV